ncbi:MAG: lipase maturation factor family protein [Verrucomicrobiota bacterium]
MLHNDPTALGLFAGNPFPDPPPRYVRVELYVYHFAPPGNPGHVWWTRDLKGEWLPAYSAQSTALQDLLRQMGWLDKDNAAH